MNAARWASFAGVVGALLSVVVLACAGGGFHPLPSQIDLLERHRSAQVGGPPSVLPGTAASDSSLEQKIDESLATLYALLERQADLMGEVDQLRSRTVVPPNVAIEAENLAGDILAAERTLRPVLDVVQPAETRELKYEGLTLTVSSYDECVEVYESPTEAFDPLFCVSVDTPIFECVSFDRTWTKGLVYHQGVVHEIFISAGFLRELDSNRRDLTR